MKLTGPRAKMRLLERRGVDYADDGVECRAGRVRTAAMHRLMGCPVKLQSAQSTLGSVVGLSSVVAYLIMFSVMYIVSRIEDE
jgi:hypothetical protein